MPKLSIATPRYRRKSVNGHVYGVVTLSGQDFYLPGPHNSKTSVREYDRLVAEWLAAGRTLPSATSGDATTIDKLAVEFFKHCRQYYRKHGKVTNEVAMFQSCIKIVRELYSDTIADHFGPLQLEAVRQKMIDRKLSRKVINKHIRRVKMMFRWGVEKNLIADASNTLKLNCVAGLKIGRSKAKETTPIEPVDHETVKATTEHLSKIVTDMVNVQLLTGARPAEICDMRPKDIDRTSEVWVFRPYRHKCENLGKERRIYIAPVAQAILKPYMRRPKSMFCFSPEESLEQHRRQKHLDRVTPKHYGNGPGTNRKSKPKWKPGVQYDTASYRRAIHRACDRAGLDRWSPNRLRHTRASEIRKTFGLDAAQVVCGHSSANTTEIYAELDRQRGSEVMKKIG